jgi:scyllo-inositol 2-dehydrogenase (NADP+)
VIEINAGLIGYGKAGSVFHAPLIEAVDGLNLRVIVQRHGDEAARQHPAAIVIRHHAEVLGDDAIQLVVIATPNELHFELARQALLAGKHVVVDKPFTVTSSQAAELIALAGRVDRRLTVFHNRRWDGDFLTVKQLLAQRTLGIIASFESRFDRYRNEPRPGSWREAAVPGSGLLYDLGPHLIDQALQLFGEPQSLDADVRRERSFGAADDAFEIQMKYPDFEVTLGAGMLVSAPTPRFTLRGSEGTWIKYGLDPQEANLQAGRSPREQSLGVEPSSQWGTLTTHDGERKIATVPGSYLTFYENVRDAIGGRAPLTVPADEARATIAIIERALSIR